MHNDHHFWWRYFPKKELTQVYISAAIRSFAISLISLFVPLYLYVELGYSLNQTIWMFMVYAVALAVFSPIAAKFAARFGFKHSVLVSVPLYLGFIGMLYLLPFYKIPLYVLGITLGTSLAFYWMGMHLIFMKASDCKHRGEEVGKRESISILATMVGPILGGLLINLLGFKPVFLFTGILLFISAFFLFLSKDQHTRYHFSLTSLFDPKEWKNYLFFISRGTRALAAGVIWPLFIFVILKDYLSLGIVESILAGISAFLLWFMGRYSDHLNKHKILHWTTWFEALSWGGRALVTTIDQILSVTIFGSLTYGIFEAPAGALEYDKACGDKTAYFVNREIFICVGRLLVGGVVLLTSSLIGGLLFNGVATFATFLF
ncbi:MAG: MFS transporter [Candidatus Woesearchaeota archaeon]|jgi:MFS family permease